MASKREAGFGLIEVLIVLVIVSIIGVVGFTVYSNHNKPATNRVGESSDVTLKPQKPDPYAGWVTYASEKEGLTISYPSTWTYKSTKTTDVFDSFTLTGPGGFVIKCSVATIPLDGGEGGRKVVFVDNITNANYTKPLYVVGHYNPEYNNLDTISVTDVKFNVGDLDAGPRGFFASMITEKMQDFGKNYVYLEGSFPTYKTAEGYDASPTHKDFDTNDDLKTARQILGTLKYR